MGIAKSARKLPGRLFGRSVIGDRTPTPTKTAPVAPENPQAYRQKFIPRGVYGDTAATPGVTTYKAENFYGEGGKVNPNYNTSKFQDVGAGISMGVNMYKDGSAYQRLGGLIGGAIAGLINPDLAGAQQYMQNQEMAKKMNEEELLATDNAFKIRERQNALAKSDEEARKTQYFEGKYNLANNDATNPEEGLSSTRESLALMSAQQPEQRDPVKYMTMVRRLAYWNAKRQDPKVSWNDFSNLTMDQLNNSKVYSVSAESSDDMELEGSTGRRFRTLADGRRGLYSVRGEDGKAIVNYTQSQYLNSLKKTYGDKLNEGVAREAWDDAVEYMNSQRLKGVEMSESQFYANAIRFADQVYTARTTNSNLDEIRITDVNGMERSTRGMFTSSGRLAEELKAGGTVGPTQTPKTEYQAFNYTNAKSGGAWSTIHPEMAKLSTLDAVTAEYKTVRDRLQTAKPKERGMLNDRALALRIRAAELMGYGSDYKHVNLDNFIKEDGNTRTVVSETFRPMNSFQTQKDFIDYSSTRWASATQELNSYTAEFPEIEKAPPLVQSRVRLLRQWLADYNRAKKDIIGDSPRNVSMSEVGEVKFSDTWVEGDSFKLGGREYKIPAGYPVAENPLPGSPLASYIDKLWNANGGRGDFFSVRLTNPPITVYRMVTGKGKVSYGAVHDFTSKKLPFTFEAPQAGQNKK